jgi:arylsulfatase A-like enzyme
MDACRDTPPNVLIVVLDTVRAANLSCYGYSRATTPFLDKFVLEGTLFENAYAPAPWTLPSHASMLTGLYPSEHRAHAKHTYLDKALPYLPEMLRSAGYETCLCTYVPFLSDNFGMDRGFAHTYQPYQILSKPAWLREWLADRMWGRKLVNTSDHVCQRIAAKMGDFGARPITKAAIQWISERPRDKNWFMLVNYFDAHLPYWPPPEFRKAFLPTSVSATRLKKVNQNPWAYYSGRAPMSAEDFLLLECLYDAEILCLDHWTGRLIHFLRESSRLEDTLVIITSDHGENLTEKPVFGHNLYLNEQLLRVPLIVRCRQRFCAGQRITQRVQLLDIFYTILETVGLSGWQRPMQAVRTRSLTEAVSNGDFDSPIFAQYHGLRATPDDERHKLRYPEVDFEPFDRPSYAVIKGQYKLIYTPGHGGKLYNLNSDPAETNDLYKSEPEIAEELRFLLYESFKSQLDVDEGERDIDPEVERRLADLGYI